MGDSIRITLAQMTSTASHDGNVALLEDIVTKAVSDQTTILALPEVVGLMNKNYASLAKSVKKAHKHPWAIFGGETVFAFTLQPVKSQ